MMRYLYNAIFYFSIPIVMLRLAWRARKNPAYLKRLPERIGFYKKDISRAGIWIHAVSVGEVLAAVPLVKALRKQNPLVPIIMTTTTITGGDRVSALLANLVTHLYLPYDFPDAINRFLKKIQPRLAILMETELWPNLLHYCGKKKIPVILANARLSNRSADGYARFKKLTHTMLQNFTLIIAQTQDDADRFIKLGVHPDKIKITGSIKFDLEIPADITDKAKAIRQIWGNNRPIWIASSTHEGEEEKVLQAFTLVRKILPETLLVLVPRHPERFKSVATLCHKYNYTVVTRTENKSCSAETQIFIGDTMGELLLFYAAADIAYVGGSMVQKGGQNPLEPAALGLPILTGPYVFNFALINQQLQAIQAVIQVNNVEELAEQVIELLQNENKRQLISKYAKEFVAKNKGALAKHLEAIQLYINR